MFQSVIVSASLKCAVLPWVSGRGGQASLGAARSRRFGNLSALVLIGAGLIAVMAAPFARAQGFPQTFADIVEDVLPTVVVVQVETPPNPGGLNLEDFFGGEAPGGTGSGFFIDTEGHIATNEHVVSVGTDVSVVLNDGTVRPAEVLGFDVDTDLAVLKIDPEGLEFKPVEWADSDEVRVGDWVIAVGNPLDVGVTVTHGIVSALDRDLSYANPFDQRIQTDAAINSGNSGGPSFNIDGKVIGVNQSIVSRTGGSVGLGFMIPSNVARQIVDQLRAFGEVRRGFLGITFSELSDDLRDRTAYTGASGVFVENVFEGLPADQAGIQAGDIIVTFQGREIAQQSDFIQMVAATPPGSRVTLTVFREGETFEVTVELTLRQIENLPNNQALDLEELQNFYGGAVVPLTLSERLLRGLNPNEGGVRLVFLTRGGPLASAGLLFEDIIQAVDDTLVFDPEEFFNALEASRESGAQSVELAILRNGEPMTIELSLP